MRGRLFTAVLLSTWMATAFAAGPFLRTGFDWTLPAWVQPTADTGLFSENAIPAQNVNVRVVDLTWKQLNPSEGVWSQTATGSAQGMSLASYNNQMAGSDGVWLRVWASAGTWAPTWMKTKCVVVALVLLCALCPVHSRLRLLSTC